MTPEEVKEMKRKGIVYEIVPYVSDAERSTPERYSQLDIFDGLLRETVRADGWGSQKWDNGCLEGVPLEVFNANLERQILAIKEKYPGASRFSMVWYTTYDHSELQLQYLRPLTTIEKERYRVWKERQEATAKFHKERQEAKERATLAQLSKKYGTDATTTGRVSSRATNTSNTSKRKTKKD